MHSISVWELLIIFGIIIVLFGGSRLASVGKALGEGISNFKKGLNKSQNSEQKSSDLTKQSSQYLEEKGLEKEALNHKKKVSNVIEIDNN
jgi:sec-independent protein translocase protein TatA